MATYLQNISLQTLSTLLELYSLLSVIVEALTLKSMQNMRNPRRRINVCNTDPYMFDKLYLTDLSK